MVSMGRRYIGPSVHEVAERMAAVKRAYLLLSDDERRTVDALCMRLQRRAGIGPLTALEIVAVIGMAAAKCAEHGIHY